MIARFAPLSASVMDHSELLDQMRRSDAQDHGAVKHIPNSAGDLPMVKRRSRTGNAHLVSGVGDDANPCSRRRPARRLPGNFENRSGGEIDALDPGGYGAVTITKAITIDGGGGQVASILLSRRQRINVQAERPTSLHCAICA